MTARGCHEHHSLFMGSNGGRARHALLWGRRCQHTACFRECHLGHGCTTGCAPACARAGCENLLRSGGLGLHLCALRALGGWQGRPPDGTRVQTLLQNGTCVRGATGMAVLIDTASCRLVGIAQQTGLPGALCTAAALSRCPSAKSAPLAGRPKEEALLSTVGTRGADALRR